MSKSDRRDLLRAGISFAALPGAMLFAGCSGQGAKDDEEKKAGPADTEQASAKGTETEQQDGDPAVAEDTNPELYYVEIVTTDVDSVCALYSGTSGAEFGEPDANLGGAKTATMRGGVRLGVRAPMHAGETPVVRPYVAVSDIKAAVKACEDAGGQVMVPPMKAPDGGQYALVLQGGIQCGFWQH